jgi:integrase
MALTQKTIAKLKAPARGNTITYDGEVPGFGVRITSAGVVSYILNYRIKNRERRYTIGRHPEYSLVRARNEAIELRGDVSQGKDPLEHRKREREAPTVQDLRDDYLERHARPYKRASSVEGDEAMLDLVIVPRLGRIAVDAVTRRDIEELHQSLKPTPYRANRVLALLSKMFSLAVVWKWRADNPAHGVPRFQEDRRERWLSTDEMARLAEALTNYPKKRASELDGTEKQKRHTRSEAQRAVNALRLIMLTGARKSEVLNATWDQFDMERAIWNRQSHQTKQKKQEHVPLSEAAIALLESLPKDGPLLFPGRKRGQPLAEVKFSWAEICTDAKIANVRVHDLRHNFASYLVSGGVSLHIVGKLLGHTQAQTTARYAHLADSPLRDAANAFGKIVTGKR